MFLLTSIPTVAASVRVEGTSFDGSSNSEFLHELRRLGSIGVLLGRSASLFGSAEGIASQTATLLREPESHCPATRISRPERDIEGTETLIVSTRHATIEVPSDSFRRSPASVSLLHPDHPLRAEIDWQIE